MTRIGPGYHICPGLSTHDVPWPPNGAFVSVDQRPDGGALPLLFAVPMLGLVIAAEACSEEGGFGSEGAPTNEVRCAGPRKRLTLYEPPPHGASDGLPPPAKVTEDGVEEIPVATQVRQLERFRDQIYQVLPVVASRSQLVGAEELPELVCTIHVVNHIGESWSEIKNDSLLSLYKPWGLDSTHPPPNSRQLLASSPEYAALWQQWRHQTAESTSLITAWRDELVEWLDEELAAAGSLEFGVLDCMLGAGRSRRGAFRAESDKLVVPGIFSDFGLGAERYCNSLCYREGRVLHYVIASHDLKPGGPKAWRPDPIGSHRAQLFMQAASSPSSGMATTAFGNGQVGRGLSTDANRPRGLWRDCLLRMSSRSVIYFIRKSDLRDYEGGESPEWTEPVWRDHGDILEFNVPFFFIDRMEMGRDEKNNEEGLLTIHGRLTPRGSAQSASRFADVAPGAEVRRPSDAPANMPFLFRLPRVQADMWAKIIDRFAMHRREQHIADYFGPVKDHSRMPGLLCRHGPEGEQLWLDGTRYSGSWQAHVYHGYGLLRDATGQITYRGQWECGLKHGEGYYVWQQSGGGRRAYSGSWCYEEFSGKGELCVLEADYLASMRRERPWAIVRYKGNFCGSGNREGASNREGIVDFDRLDPQHAMHTIEDHFPMLDSDWEKTGRPRQGPGLTPRDLAAEFYGQEGADLGHCGPDKKAEVWYADGTHYQGPVLAGAVPHGKGGLLWDPGEAGGLFEGDFENGLRVGTGRFTLSSGLSYEGQFCLGGRRHGHGTVTVPSDGAKTIGFKTYTGQYQNGLRHGEGEMIFWDGSTYTGSFYENLRHGFGTYRCRPDNQEGNFFKGNWHADKPGTGKAEITYPRGLFYEGLISDGCRDGSGVLFTKGNDGSRKVLYDGQWEMDQMHGSGTLKSWGGTYYGQFSHGVREGKGRFDYDPPPEDLAPQKDQDTAKAKAQAQFASGREKRRYTGEWHQDQPHGIGNYSDEYGYVLEDVTFEEGLLIGDRRPPPTGLRQKYLGGGTKWPTKFLPIKVRPSIGVIKKLPGAEDICDNNVHLPSEELEVFKPLDVGTGAANARTRAAHLGPEGGKGYRWA
eukprot:TRINITY_DN37961_c0_g1_i1.p1 TRINITY_DN37961_c0_g1~~TRINITY_DN37961_c0_g1_i1.p1  ORF type:complete len:1194 (+),score=185.74 TRINITY_DN37961_c0_g1_i1:315-3584(+)